MLRVGIQTKGIMEEHKWERGCQKIHAAGFDCVDFNLDCFLLNSDVYAGKLNSFFDKSKEELEAYFMPFREAMVRYQLTPSQMHAPYPVMVYGKDEQNQYMRDQVIPKSFQVAEFLQIPYMVIHPFKLQYKLGKEAEWQQNLDYFRSLIPLAKQHGVMVCLENLYEGFGGRLVEGVGSQPSELVRLTEALNESAGEELFGICLDTGHMNLVKRNPYEAILIFGQHLKILHLHDNDAAGDLHQMPYSFQDETKQGRGILWTEVLQGLKEIHFDGVLSFETFPCMNSFPLNVAEQVLQTIQDIGRYWAAEIQ